MGFGQFVSPAEAKAAAEAADAATAARAERDEAIAREDKWRADLLAALADIAEAVRYPHGA